jgi:hypothetical protein
MLTFHAIALLLAKKTVDGQRPFMLDCPFVSVKFAVKERNMWSKNWQQPATSTNSYPERQITIPTR